MRAGNRPIEEFQGSDPRAPFCRASVVERLIRRLELAPGSEVLEWGVARGTTAVALAKLGMSVTLVEPEEETLDRVLQTIRVEVNAVKAERPPKTMAVRSSSRGARRRSNQYSSVGMAWAERIAISDPRAALMPTLSA